MRAPCLASLLFFATATALAATEDGDLKPQCYYVAPEGNDAWSGTVPAPDAGKTDGPFATLARARDEIRKQKTAATGQRGFAVSVREGIYCLAEPFTLTSDDGGTADAPIVYRAYPGERPVLVGGRRIGGFVPHQGEILKADVEKGSVYAPTLETVVKITGASNVTLKSFTIECCEGTAVELSGCTDCRIAGSTIRNVGGRCSSAVAAVSVSGGSNVGVVGCDIYEVGSHAVQLTGLDGVPPEEQWTEWQKHGFDQHSVVADPLFVDPENDDHRLKADSPAFGLGFKPIPVDEIGPYESPDRASWPIREATGAREAGFRQATLEQ